MDFDWVYLKLTNRNSIQIEEFYQQKLMQNAQPQFLLMFTQAYFLSKIMVICLMLMASRYLLILFTELNSHGDDKIEEKTKEGGEIDSSLSVVLEMKSIYHMLMLILYFVYTIFAMLLPLQLLTQFQFKIAFLFSCVLLCSCGEVIPRIILNSHHSRTCIKKWRWIITLAKFLNKLIPLNGLLRKIFNQQVNHHISYSYLTKDNIHRLLYYSEQTSCQRPIRQEWLQLLEKLRQLSMVDTESVMIPKKNIFLLDIKAVISSKMVNHLGKYYFSKVLIYEKTRDNIIGYLQFKQLLSFDIDQKISQQSHVICRNLVVVYNDSNLSTVIDMMIDSKINFAIVRERRNDGFVGLVKLKDIFSRLLLKWYNYGGLTADRAFYNKVSMSMNLGRDEKGIQEAQQKS